MDVPDREAGNAKALVGVLITEPDHGLVITEGDAEVDVDNVKEPKSSLDNAAGGPRGLVIDKTSNGKGRGHFSRVRSGEFLGRRL